MSATSGASRRARDRRNRSETDERETDERETDAYDSDEYVEDDAENADDAEDADGAEDVDYSDDDADDGEVGAGSGGMSATDAAEAGVRHVVRLTGRQALGVTGLERTADGWVVEVEVVEDRRVPSSSDTLGLYRAEFDTEGSVVGYRRTRRYPRGRGDGREEG
jgi:hypothetical protein